MKLYNKVINSKELGIPQSRDRLYIIGVLNKDKRREFIFPKGNPMLNINDYIDKSNKTEML